MAWRSWSVIVAGPYWQVSCLMIVMNDITTDTPMLTETTSRNQQAQTADNEASLEQKMADLGLCNDTKRFLRHLHVAEKQLNDAFNKGRQGGELEERVSEVYRDLYGAGCSARASR
jgi:hypothetical protein